MYPVYSIADILEHALEGHEEVSILEACFTAKGLEEQRDSRVRCRAPAMTHFIDSQTCLNGTVFPCLRLSEPNRKALSP